MDPEARQLMRNNLKLTEENNEMLKKLYRAHKWGVAWRIFYWTLIIALTFGAYYFIQPFLDQIKNITGGTLNFEQFMEKFKN